MYGRKVGGTIQSSSANAITLAGEAVPFPLSHRYETPSRTGTLSRERPRPRA